MLRAFLPIYAVSLRIDNPSMNCARPKSIDRWLLVGCILVTALGGFAPQAQVPAFPFTIQDGLFHRGGQPVFLHLIGYQPLEPGQAVDGQIREARVQDDLNRLRSYRDGNQPLAIRVYPQPTSQYPVRIPKSFYDGIRALGFWIVRDIYFNVDFTAPNAIANGKAAIDLVIAEIATVEAFDRVFAWELANEFQASGNNIVILQNFLAEMRNHIKTRMAEPGRQAYSNWVTWTSWPPSDPLRTGCSPGPSGCNPILVPSLDYVSFNAYSYDPERMRDHQGGATTGTPYAGYLAALKARFPSTPVVISESGLPDSSAAVGLDQTRLLPAYPSYRRGALTSEQSAEGLGDRYWDARLAEGIAGFGVFEWLDEWWKAGYPDSHSSDPEESFGLGRFSVGSPPQLQFKLQQEAIRELYTMRLPAAAPILSDVTADSSSLPALGTTTLRATVAAGVATPVRFRWESTRGRIVGESDTVQFHAGGVSLGQVVVTVVGIDRWGNATRLSVTIGIEAETPGAEILTFGTSRSSGRVTGVNLAANKVVLYVRTNQYYVQPFTDMKSIWVRSDGYWWSPNFAPSRGGELYAWVVPNSFDPPAIMTSPPAGVLATATRNAINDSDNDLLPDAFEPNPSNDRYDDGDSDGANNLEELLGGTNPGLADNDVDADGLHDTWERVFFANVDLSASSDPDSDGLSNSRELSLGTHPGRANVDADSDGLPDSWERRRFGNLGHGATDVDAHQLTNLDTYQRGVLLFSDDILTAQVTAVRLVHVTELRERINMLRARYGLAAFNWSNPVPAIEQPIRAQHIVELREALSAAYAQAGRTTSYPTDPILNAGMIIRAGHIRDLRTSIVALE